MSSLRSRWTSQVSPETLPPESPTRAPESEYPLVDQLSASAAKQRNDWIRKQEFDYLRKLRRCALLVEDADFDTRPSLLLDIDTQIPIFQESQRTLTLRKINEIEAQVLGGLDTRPVSTAFSTLSGEEHSATTRAPSLSRPFKQTQGIQSTQPPASIIPASPETFIVTDPEPEVTEASILFANDDLPGAQSCMAEAIDARGHCIALWLAFFDFYRATHQADLFSNLAIDYTARFSLAAPIWFDIVDLSGSRNPTPQLEPAHWSSPPSLAQADIDQLSVKLLKVSKPWRLDWSKLEQIEEGALKPLTQWLQTCDAQNCAMEWLGSATLLALLQTKTISQDANVNEDWWKLHLEVLRILNEFDAFESLALDYCVTYEMSPPWWQAPSSPCIRLESRLEAERQASQIEVQKSPSQALHEIHICMGGAMQGDISEALHQAVNPTTHRHLKSRNLIIDCAHLIRIDPAAAKSLLNWIQEIKRQEADVELKSLHHMAWAFLHVMGFEGVARLQAT